MYTVVISIVVWLIGSGSVPATQCTLLEGSVFKQSGMDKYHIQASPTGSGNICPQDQDFVIGRDDLNQLIAAGKVQQN